MQRCSGNIVAGLCLFTGDCYEFPLDSAAYPVCLAMVGFALACCAWPCLPAVLLLQAVMPAHAARPVHISLIALNDLHGNLHPPGGSVLMPDADRPQGTAVAAGGVAYLASLVQQLKAANPQRTLVVAAGDLVGASPLVSSLFHDEPTIEVLNLLGLDISSVGNHEFDKGRDELLRLQNGGCHPRAEDGSVGIIGQDTCMNAGHFAGAQFQYLAANVVDIRSGQTLFPATALRTVGGVTIGFIGLTLHATPSVVTPTGVAGLRFLNEVETVNRLAPALRAQGAAAVVVLLHQGGQTSAKLVQDASCPDFRGPILPLVDRMSAAVDVVISGHTHQEYICQRPDGKLLTQAGSYGRLLTRIDLQVERVRRKVLRKAASNFVVLNGAPRKDADGQPLPLPQGSQALPPDAAVQAVVQRYTDQSAPLAEQPVGRLAEALTRRSNVAGESTLGAVIADAYLAATSGPAYSQQPAQIAFTNPGGLRSDLLNLRVSYGQLFSVLPFNNTLVSMDLTGQQILRLLEQQWERPQPAGGRILPVSNGFTYTWDAKQPASAAPGTGGRVLPGSMRLHGQPIDMNSNYRVTVNSFMSSGGDNFNVLHHGRNVQEGEVDIEATKRYFRSQPVLQVPEMGRIGRVD
ncbi:MAG: bifunctional metallophosphatase/5'-nucleotidase [Rhodoferax sp.]|nr:bifunctional metallophosphatase/5'-nucleotidase [Rhodoferax sp.]